MKTRFLLGLLLALLIPQLAMAQVSFIRDYKAKMVLELSPGEEITHSFKAINITTRPQEMDIFVTDGVITPTGSYTTTSQYEKQNFVGTWIKLSQPTLHLDPKETKEVEFTVRAPTNATPGTYAGGFSLIPKAATESALPTVTGARTSMRIVSSVFVKIKGEKITSYALDSFTHRYENGHVFSFDFRNDGNTLLKAQGEIEIRNSIGEMFTAPLGDITLLKNSKQTSTVNWDKKPFWGFFTATAKIKVFELDLDSNSYKEVGLLEETINFSVVPWVIVIPTLALLILIVSAVIIKKISRKAYLKKCASYVVAEGETMLTIAAKNKADWRKLVDINNLKAPFELRKGQKILLPPKK